MIAQDTGGAIKGEIRGDVFWGFGDKAALMAGHMNNEASFILLLPNGAELPD
jgi:membrane-bound lytic murein transglycosylase A